MQSAHFDLMLNIKNVHENINFFGASLKFYTSHGI